MSRFVIYLLLSSLLLTSTLIVKAQAANPAPTSTTAAPSSQAGVEPQDQLLTAAATQKGSGWIFGVGFASAEQGYVGYSRQNTPVPLVFYHNGRFFFAGFSAGYLLSNGHHYRFSIIAAPEINRLKASDSPQLAGIQSRQWSVNGGANLDLFGNWGRFNVSLLHDLLNRNKGTSLNTGYHYSIRFGGWTLTPGLGVKWQSADLTNYYYGVSPAEVISGRPAYSPGSATSPYAEIGLSTPLSKHWQLSTNLQYLRYSSTIHDSPIVDRSGSTTLFIGLIYNPR